VQGNLLFGVVPVTLKDVRKERKLHIKVALDISAESASRIDRILNAEEYEQERILLIQMKELAIDSTDKVE